MSTSLSAQLIYSTIHTDKVTIRNSNDAFKVFIDNWNIDTIELHEEFKILLLNRGNQVLGIYNHSKGGVHTTVADVRLILTCALKGAASGMILCHNHPSNNLKPSKCDKELTQKIKQGAKILEINVLDHLIIGKEGYYSFGDEGII